MREQSTSYKVTQNWGDPREPDYQNDIRIAYVTYSEGEIMLYFRVVGARLPNSEIIQWTLKAPRNTRKILGKRWTDRETIFQRVIGHLENLEFSYGSKSVSKPFSGVLLDTSEIPGWLSFKIEELTYRLDPILRRLPSRNIFTILTIGFAMAYVKEHHRQPWLPDRIALVTILLAALLSLALLYREVLKTLEMTMSVFGWMRFSNYGKNWRLEALKIWAHQFGARSFLTLLLSIFLISLVWY